MRLLMSDENLSLRGKILRDAIAEDKQRGLIPFYVRLLHAVHQCDFVPPFGCIVHVYYTKIPCSQSPRKTRDKPMNDCAIFCFAINGDVDLFGLSLNRHNLFDNLISDKLVDTLC